MPEKDTALLPPERIDCIVAEQGRFHNAIGVFPVCGVGWVTRGDRTGAGRILNTSKRYERS